MALDPDNYIHSLFSSKLRYKNCKVEVFSEKEQETHQEMRYPNVTESRNVGWKHGTP